jgi:hypothetical protein
MEFVENTAGSQSVVTNLLKRFEILGDEYTLQAARKQMLDNLISGQLEVDPVDNANANAVRDQFLSKIKELSVEFAALREATKPIDENEDAQLDENIRIEINRGEELLKRIAEEQKIVHESLVSSKNQIDLLKSEDAALKDNKAPSVKPIEIVIDNTQLRSTQKAHKEAEVLFAGLSNLTGVKSFKVSETKNEAGVQFVITIGDSNVTATLSADDMRVTDIQIKPVIGFGAISRCSYDVQKLLDDCRVLPSPQDLRYVVFAISASQGAKEAALKDLPELRKQSILKVLDSHAATAARDAPILRFQLELRGRVVATVSVHDCYPEVPCGVHLDSLLGPDGTPEEAQALDKIKAETNNKCFRTIPDMFAHLTGPQALGAL